MQSYTGQQHAPHTHIEPVYDMQRKRQFALSTARDPRYHRILSVTDEKDYFFAIIRYYVFAKINREVKAIAKFNLNCSKVNCYVFDLVKDAIQQYPDNNIISKDGRRKMDYVGEITDQICRELVHEGYERQAELDPDHEPWYEQNLSLTMSLTLDVTLKDKANSITMTIQPNNNNNGECSSNNVTNCITCKKIMKMMHESIAHEM